jgi:hypothetical protein
LSWLSWKSNKSVIGRHFVIVFLSSFPTFSQLVGQFIFWSDEKSRAASCCTQR